MEICALLVFRCEPSGEKDRVSIISSSQSVLRQDPVLASQSRIVLSPEPDAISWPFGDKATASTQCE